jgi:hypothetical protein
MKFSIFQVSMVCYPVCHYPCRTILDDATRYVLQGRIKEGFSWTLHVILTLVLCGAALGTSLLTSDLGTVSFPCPTPPPPPEAWNCLEEKWWKTRYYWPFSQLVSDLMLEPFYNHKESNVVAKFFQTKIGMPTASHTFTDCWPGEPSLHWPHLVLSPMLG